MIINILIVLRNDAMYVYIIIYVCSLYTIRKSLFPNILVFNALRDLTATLYKLRDRTMHENFHA